MACSSDAECGVGNICGRVPYSATFQPNLCLKECKRDADCPVNGFDTQTCILSEDIVSDSIVFSCGFFAPIGAGTSSGGTFKDWGQEMGANDACVYAVQLTAGGKLYCTRPCVTAADCGGALPACNKGGIANPSGSGSSIISVCGT